MSSSVRKCLFLAICAVFMLSTAFLFGRPVSADSPISDSSPLFWEVELEEGEDSTEKEPFVSSVEFSIEISASTLMSMVHHAVLSVEESNRFDTQVPRGPPGKCAVDGRLLFA